MKRRTIKFNNNEKTTVAFVVIQGKECKAIVYDYNKKLCFKETNALDKDAMGLSLGVYSTQPLKYDYIKRQLTTKFSKNDSCKIITAIKAAPVEAVTKEIVAEETAPVEAVAEEIIAEETAPVEAVAEEIIAEETVPVEITNMERYILREKSCYDHSLIQARKILDNIEGLKTEGIPIEYINSRYPDIESMISVCASRINVQWLNLSFAETRVKDLRKQLLQAEYEMYLAQEGYITTMRDQVEYLETLDDLNMLVMEDQNEIRRLNRIKELEAELADLKGKSKFDNDLSTTTTTTAVEEKPEKSSVELAVELATDVQDKEVRYLANHLYQVRRGNEKPNPVIYRKIAKLSEDLKLSKGEFCKKILSINYSTYDRHHREFMNSLGLRLHGEPEAKPITKYNGDLKAQITQWANIHLISSSDTDNQVLNKDVYNAFTKDTGIEVSERSFYLILKRTSGYVTENVRHWENIDGKQHLLCQTFYSGYRLV